MTIFSTYRCVRVLSPEFGKRWATYLKRVSDHYAGRPWQMLFLFPMDCTLFVGIVAGFQFMYRFHGEITAVENDYQCSVLKRWGPSPEDLRKQLSSADIIHARAFVRI